MQKTYVIATLQLAQAEELASAAPAAETAEGVVEEVVQGMVGELARAEEACVEG